MIAAIKTPERAERFLGKTLSSGAGIEAKCLYYSQSAFEDFKANPAGQASSFESGRGLLPRAGEVKQLKLFQKLSIGRYRCPKARISNFYCSRRASSPLKPKMEFDLQIVNRHFPDLTETQTRQLGNKAYSPEPTGERFRGMSQTPYGTYASLATKTVDFRQYSDFGCWDGGGFPAFRSHTYPECQFQLIDSVGKKIKLSDCIES